MQAAALTGEGEELRPVLAPEHAQTDARARRRRCRFDLGGAERFVGATAEHRPFHAWSIKAHARIEWRAMRVLAPVVLIVLLAAGCGVSSYESQCSGGSCSVSVKGTGDFEFGDQEGVVSDIGDGSVELEINGHTETVRVGEPATFGPYTVTVKSAGDGETEFTVD